MRRINLDIETYSSVDLKDAGVYRYSEAEDFRVLLLAYSLDGTPVKVVDIEQGELIPEEVREALQDPSTEKRAFNAQFERVCLSKILRVSNSGWVCTKAQAANCRHIGGLGKVAERLGVTEQKDKSGEALIRFFSVPCKPTAKNGNRTRNEPRHEPERWELFKKYCAQDVRTEMAIAEALEGRGLSEYEQHIYNLDQIINDRGAQVDEALIAGACAIDEAESGDLLQELQQLTGLDNPNSVAQLKSWLEEQGEVVSSLSKGSTADIVQTTKKPIVRRALELREQLATSSNAKYAKLAETVNQDGRVRGLFQYFGAGTGRWAGRLVQVQNLPRGSVKAEKLDEIRERVKAQDREGLKAMTPNPRKALSSLIRTAFIASPGCRLAVADYSAIEARVLAWLAGESWTLEAFEQGKDLYCETATQMFGVPVTKTNENKDLRQKGKAAVLACGYGGGVKALIAMGALNSGMHEEELPGIVKGWRRANSRIVRYWRDLETSAKRALQFPGAGICAGRITFTKSGSYLVATLPSGRELYFPDAQIQLQKYGESVTYSQALPSGLYVRTELYGGKIAENVTQAVARDLLAEALIRLEARKYPVVLHVHDEAVVEFVPGFGSADEVCRIMSTPPTWADGLPLKAEGFEADYYRKD